MYIHPTASVEESVNIGNGTSIWHKTIVRRGSTIGDECILGSGIYVDTDVNIGNRVKIQNSVSIYLGVTIDDGVFVGPHATFTNDKIPRSINPDGTLKDASDWIVTKTYVGYGASIGANATIVCGVNIGKWAMIGAGAVVTKDVPDYGLVLGNPAKLVGYVTPEGIRVDKPIE